MRYIKNRDIQTLELLAPAKNLECGIAAIDHGADAVYIGADHFGARAAAGNSTDDIARLCSYAHQFGARVYVTVNTIVYDNEIDSVRRLLKRIGEAGADAILVQDMALVSMLSDIGLEMHASTQTDNRTADKVEWLRGLGFKRVVLARELSVDEIAEIHAKHPDVELEVFVHGALCVSYSGQCYASQYCFQRSANRGECAQFCRLKFDLVDAEGKVIEHDRHLLSLKDMCQIDNLERLAEAGAVSFKIEGRLKDVAYVKNVTAAYSRRLDEIVAAHPDKYRRASFGRVDYGFDPDLRKTFNRGYTTYFADGRQPDIFSPDTPKALGEYVGKVKEVKRQCLTVSGVASFANGDGLCFINADRQLEGFRVNRAEGNRLYPSSMPRNLRQGVALYRNNDQQFERLLSRPSAVRRLSITMSLSATESGFALDVATEDGRKARVEAKAEHTVAQKPQHENIVRQLSKLGTTIYDCTNITIPDDFPWFVPSSLLAQMRRDACAEVSEHSLTSKNPSPQTVHPSPLTYKNPSRPPYLLNASNTLAVEFYRQLGVEASAFETQKKHGEGEKLMQCRFCLRHALGYCVNKGGRKPQWKEPLFLRLPDGRKFQLQFNCKRCEMYLLS
ncbi:MAG: U32 family peptidase [Prevotellaceae bacterium]|nr:U32 family peptidase [Prevotellaceae bacterium]